MKLKRDELSDIAGVPLSADHVREIETAARSFRYSWDAKRRGHDYRPAAVREKCERIAKAARKLQAELEAAHADARVDAPPGGDPRLPPWIHVPVPGSEAFAAAAVLTQWRGKWIEQPPGMPDADPIGALADIADAHAEACKRMTGKGRSANDMQRQRRQELAATVARCWTEAGGAFDSEAIRLNTHPGTVTRCGPLLALLAAVVEWTGVSVDDKTLRSDLQEKSPQI